jgi:hypothetical protein
MLSPEQLLAFLLVALAITASPGPDNLMVLGMGMSKGRKPGMAFGLGCALGCLSHTALAVAGVSALVAASPTALTVLRWAGGLYLVWLGVQSLRSQGGARRQGLGVQSVHNSGIDVLLRESGRGRQGVAGQGPSQRGGRQGAQQQGHPQWRAVGRISQGQGTPKRPGWRCDPRGGPRLGQRVSRWAAV